MLCSWSGPVRFEAGLSRHGCKKSIAKTTASVALRKLDRDPLRRRDDNALKSKVSGKGRDNHLASFVEPP
jgi:hypothetical protein